MTSTTIICIKAIFAQTHGECQTSSRAGAEANHVVADFHAVGDETEGERDVSKADRLRGEIETLESTLETKRRELERAERRNWEVAWYQQLLLLAGQCIDPETLEDGLTEEEAQIKRIHWAASLADGVGVVVIARMSPGAVNAMLTSEETTQP
jgi:hypothetical protein